MVRSIRIPSLRITRAQSLIAALTLFVAVAMLCLDGTRDGDLYLQLASGRFIATHGLSAVDPFQTIAHGEPWLNQQWLNELLIYHVVRWIGMTGLTVAYAGLLAIPLALLLWLCRHKGIWMMTALTVLYCPGLWMIVHPRAAGFSVLAFSALVAILVSAWLRQRPQPTTPVRLRWALPVTMVIFAVWANLHGGFVAGLVLIGVVACGLFLEQRFALDNAAGPRRTGVLVLAGLLATVTVTLATPLGGEIWSYLASFRDSAISMVSSEWRPAIESPLAVVYIGAAAVFVGWLWARAPGARSLTPVLVVVTFLLLAAVSLRNIIFIGPVLAVAVASLAPDRELRIPRSLIGLALAASAGAALTWAVAVGPARNEPILSGRLIGYALRHPPRTGHIAAYAGIGSYMLWRSPRAPVELDGWLEHFSPGELRCTYAVLDGRVANPTRYVQALQIGAVIADRHRAIRALQAHGFVVEFRSRAGTYLVKQEGARGRRPLQTKAPPALGSC